MIKAGSLRCYIPMIVIGAALYLVSSAIGKMIYDGHVDKRPLQSKVERILKKYDTNIRDEKLDREELSNLVRDEF